MRLISVLVWAAVVLAAVLAKTPDKKQVQKLKEAKIENNAALNNRQVREPSTTTERPSTSSRPMDCVDHLMAGATTSGVYKIYPFTCSCSQAVLVWCDMETDGGGWTVFLHRQAQNLNPRALQVNFNRTWDEYKNGFGDASGEHWLGTELIHKMTSSRLYTLRLDLQLASGGFLYATYDNMRISNEDDKYRAYMGGTRLGALNNCFSDINGRYFTTVDRDNDYYTGNCAAKQGGGWWYYSRCRFNPTTIFVNETMTITCYYTHTAYETTMLQLKLRPKLCDDNIRVIHLKDLECGCR